ncbi:hypothetical protein [Desulfotomaculum copahuensis]|uniref:Copper amine oxidase-like N-terminal domain-containing protein n=1 Tax=Desulfotomaculum copahuensis TaxID=1838280 RepID=A0A1B7LG84_9FIRM|nr:hypothetical protein [Desulfotomaculum copahuensis]OAT83709.1 hypothetical protein A6M21_07685 [Desulfotomaculum copahuensis]
MRKILSLFFTVMLLLLFVPFEASADNTDDYSMYYGHAHMFGKIISINTSENTAIVYGSVAVQLPDYSWKTIQSKKFEQVIPENDQAAETLTGNVGKVVVLKGQLDTWQGQQEEYFAADIVEPQNYTINMPPWYAFGKAISSTMIYKFNLAKVTDFVDVLAGLANAEGISGGHQKPVMAAVRNEFEKHFNLKWCVTKNQDAANDMNNGVGGWQVYEGYLGDNCYIAGAPVIRKNIDRFMDAVKEGGTTPEKSGPAVMCAYVNVIRDQNGKIEQVTASGALYDTVPNLITAFKNPKNLNLETWKLNGWDEQTANEMDGKLCWLSGNRVLVYDKTGHLVDQYFALHNFLTRDQFNNTLNQSRDLIGEGGL